MANPNEYNDGTYAARSRTVPYFRPRRDTFEEDIPDIRNLQLRIVRHETDPHTNAGQLLIDTMGAIAININEHNQRSRFLDAHIFCTG